jgi:hypothetical protein
VSGFFFLFQSGADAEADGAPFQAGYDNTCSGVTHNSSISSDVIVTSFREK